MRLHLITLSFLAACATGTGDLTTPTVGDQGDAPDATPENAIQLGDVVTLPAGSFDMGTPTAEIGRDRDETLHGVTLTRGFDMMVTEVTQAQWVEAMGTTAPSINAECTDCPVDTINWYEALAFANAISVSHGLDACYELTDCVGTPGEDMTCGSVSVNSADGHPASCEGFRLPTEAEWEYAARSAGAVADAFPSGGNLVAEGSASCEEAVVLDDGSTLGDQAWYCGNHDGNSHPVGSLEANASGLHDMAGNVFEWTWDGYGAYAGDLVDPVGTTDALERVFRGGDWFVGAPASRMGNRDAEFPSYSSECVGIRLVRTAL